MAFDAGSVFVKIKTDITEFQKGMKSVEDRVSGLSSSLKGITDGLAEFGKKSAIFTGVIAAGLGADGVKAVRTAGDLEQSTQAFKALLGSADAAGKTMERIKKEAATTPFEIQGLTDGALALTAITKDGDKAIDTLLDVGKAIATSGKGQAELDRVIMNLQQVASTGKVTEMDIRQFQGSIPIFNDILKAAGLTTEELKQSGDAADLLFDAFKKAGAEGGIAAGGFTDQAGTFNQLWSNLMDTLNISLSDFVKASGIFEGAKWALSNLIGYIETGATQLTRVATILGNVFYYLQGIAQGEDLRAELEEALSFFFGENAGKAADFLVRLVDIFKQIGTWISEHQELVMTFLQGLGIALGVLLIVGTITALLTALLNPLVLVALAIAGLYTAWQTNFMGIRDITQKVINFVMDLFNNIFKPMFELFVGWWTERWDFIKIGLIGTWEIIKGVIQLAWAVIYGILTVGLALLQGDWGRAWEQIKKTLSIAWDGIRNILAGVLNSIIGWGGTLFHNLVKPFEDAWNKIHEFIEKIKDGLDFTQRHSPSIMDIINRSVRMANDAIGNLDFGMDVSSKAVIGAAAAVPTGSGLIANINVDLGGAFISSEAMADEIGERMGDSIVRKLQQNIRI